MNPVLLLATIVGSLAVTTGLLILRASEPAEPATPAAQPACVPVVADGQTLFHASAISYQTGTRRLVLSICPLFADGFEP